MLKNLSLSQKRIALMMVVNTIMAMFSAAFFTKPVSAAGSSCGSWIVQTCCDGQWFGLQNYEKRQCSSTTGTITRIWWEYRCNDWSTCKIQ